MEWEQAPAGVSAAAVGTAEVWAEIPEEVFPAGAPAPGEEKGAGGRLPLVFPGI